jgi:hypothetical protein
MGTLASGPTRGTRAAIAVFLGAILAASCSSGGSSGAGVSPGSCPDPIGEVPGQGWAGFVTDGTNVFVLSESGQQQQEIFMVPLAGGAVTSIAKGTSIVMAADASGLWWSGDTGTSTGLHHWTAETGDTEVGSGGSAAEMALSAEDVVIGELAGLQPTLYVSPKEMPVLTKVGSTNDQVGESIALRVAGTTAIWATQPSSSGWAVYTAALPGPSPLTSIAEGAGGIIGFTANADAAWGSVQPGDGTSAIWKFPIGGTAEKVVESAGGAWQGDVVADDAHLWWASTDGIHRATLDGADEQVVSTCVETARYLVGTPTRLIVGQQLDTMRVLVLPK